MMFGLEFAGLSPVKSSWVSLENSSWAVWALRMKYNVATKVMGRESIFVVVSNYFFSLPLPLPLPSSDGFSAQWGWSSQHPFRI